MSTPYALLRLTWRPLTLLVLPVMLVVFVMVFDQGDASFRDIWDGDSSWPVRDALWHLVALGPMVLGFLPAIYRLEMQHTTLAFALPGLKRGIRAGMLAIALPVAAMLALLMGRIAPISGAIAAFALALFWFLVPGATVDVALPRPARWLAGIVMIAGLFGGGDLGAASSQGWLGRLAEAQPVSTSLVALGCAAALLLLQTSPGLARRRPFLWSSLAPSRAQPLFWARQKQSRLAWHTSLATERLGPWLRAAVYESGDFFARGHLIVPAIAVLLGIVLGKPSWLLLFAGLGFTQRGLQLRADLPYPLSRTRRAELAYVGTLVDAGLFCGVAGLVLLMIAPLPLADLRLPWFGTDEAVAFNRWPITLGLMFAFAPLAQWAVIRWSVLENLRHMRLAGRIVYAVVYVSACALAAVALSSGTRFAGNPRATAVGVVALTILVQLVHWFALRSYFTTRDLVRRE